MSEIPWAIVVESSGASFDSIRDIFVHSLQAEHLWIRRLSGKSTEGIYAPQGSPFTKYSNVNSIQEYADVVETETNEYLKTLSDEKLRSVLEYKGRDGSVNRSVVEDILMHVVEEEIHHRGEIMCIYWQHDLQPPYTSFMVYRNQG
jgi:uncharacterized damage-inducible protein DinB